MFRLTNPTLNGKPLPGISEQATVSMDALEPWFPAPSHDTFGVAIVRPWVSPTLLRLVEPFDFNAYRREICRRMARNLGIPWEFLRHLERVS